MLRRHLKFFYFILTTSALISIWSYYKYTISVSLINAFIKTTKTTNNNFKIFCIILTTPKNITTKVSNFEFYVF